jgi:hypothetical protein
MSDTHIKGFFNIYFEGNYEEAIKVRFSKIIDREHQYVTLSKLLDNSPKISEFCEKLGDDLPTITKNINSFNYNSRHSPSRESICGWTNKSQGTMMNILYILNSLNLDDAFNYLADIFVEKTITFKLARKEVKISHITPIQVIPTISSNQNIQLPSNQNTTIVIKSSQLKGKRKHDSKACKMMFECETEGCKNAPKITFVPCGCLKFCVKCSEEIEENNECPICQEKIERYILTNY